MSSEETLRFGIVTPVVTLFGREASWEENAGPAELREIALAADRLGFAHLTCSEHVGIPTDIAPQRGSRYYDPLATFGFLAAITTRVRFLTNVVVLPYHHPLAIAKRYGTLDVLCEGRLMLGVGVGSLEPEFELLGAPFGERGDRYTDALRALRAAFGKRQPRYRGDHYAFSDFIVDPCGVQQHVPIWLGGRTPRSLRRALAAGDGWMPFSLGVPEVGALLERARAWPEWSQREGGFDVALPPDGASDVTCPGGVDAMREAVARSVQAGATVIQLSLASESLPHYLDQLAIVRESVVPEFA